MPSLVVEMVAAVAREVMVALNGEGLDSVLLRERWEAVMRGKASVVGGAVDFLAGYGLYIADSRHRTASRILCELREARDKPVARMTEPWDEAAGERGRETGLTSALGRAIAERVATSRTDGGLREGNDDIRRPGTWIGVDGANAGDLAGAAAAALDKAVKDRSAECYLVGAWEDLSTQEDWTGDSDPMLEYLDGRHREDPTLAGQAGEDPEDPRRRHVCMFTDGAYDPRRNEAGLGVAYRRVGVGAGGVDVHAQGEQAAATISTALPKRYGSARCTNHQAELLAPIVGLPRLPAGGDGLITMDNQAVIAIALRKGSLSARERSKANDNTLEDRLSRIAHRGTGRPARDGAGGSWEGALRKDGWSGAQSRVMGSVGLHPVLWTKSHQVGEPEPNRFVVEGNEEADRGAGAAGRGSTHDDVRIPVGGDRFFWVHESRMVTQEIGSYVREWGRRQAQEEWGCARKRSSQGAVAREAERLHKGTLSAMVMADHVLPGEVLGLGGSWQREHPTARAAVICGGIGRRCKGATPTD